MAPELSRFQSCTIPANKQSHSGSQDFQRRKFESAGIQDAHQLLKEVCCLQGNLHYESFLDQSSWLG